jgi:endonuclease-8
VPEGDVVLRTARRLHAALAGKELTRSDLRWPSLATADLTGRKVLEVAATGKHLLIRTEGGLTLHSHLRMDGSWHLHRTGRRWAGARPEHEIRAVLANADWTAIGHRLGMLDLVATGEESRLVGHLGPDILAADWDLDGAVSRVAAHPDRSIGETLLDQRVIAGIGTFFMSEACFLRGVNPWLRVAAVTDLAALVAMAHRLMTASADRAMQVTTGNARPGQQQWVHGRSGRPCRRCRTPIRVAELGVAPTQRVAFWCPACQPGAVPTDLGRPQRPLGAGRRGSSASGSTNSTKQYRRP